MSRRIRPFSALFSLICVLTAAHAVFGATEVQRPVGAGPLYPKDPDVLLKALDRFYAAAEPAPMPGRLFACIVPHSGYGLSGTVAAHAFKQLTPGQFDKVIVIGPSHMTRFEGCSIPHVSFFETPFGYVTLHQAVIRELCYSPLVSLRDLRYEGPAAGRRKLHEVEYSIEMTLPFLQERLSRFTLIPIVAGQLNDLNRRVDPQRIEAVADSIREVLDERTLLVISSDFTHYGHDYSFKPFGDDALSKIQALDERAFSYILNKDFDGFLSYLERSGNPICGDTALLLLLKILPANAIGVLHASGISMAQTKDPNRSVSYGAITFNVPERVERGQEGKAVRSLKITPEGSEFRVVPAEPDE